MHECLEKCEHFENKYEKDESTPPSSRHKVKCFSMTIAPSATEATAAPIPIVWSERPTWQSNNFAIWGMVWMFVFSGVAG